MYDILRLPYIMPNCGSGTEDATAAKPGVKKIYNQGGLPALGAAARSSVKTISVPANGVRMPGATSGNPGWIDKELDALDCEFAAGGPKEPYAHFEMLREAQKEWWAAEAYMRVCFLYGLMHMLSGFSYWLVTHVIIEQLHIFCSILCAGAVTSTVWIVFHLDVNPEAATPTLPDD